MPFWEAGEDNHLHSGAPGPEPPGPGPPGPGPLGPGPPGRGPGAQGADWHPDERPPDRLLDWASDQFPERPPDHPRTGPRWVTGSPFGPVPMGGDPTPKDFLILEGEGPQTSYWHQRIFSAKCVLAICLAAARAREATSGSSKQKSA